jgi:cysteine-rich repeat protein
MSTREFRCAAVCLVLAIASASCGGDGSASLDVEVAATPDADLPGGEVREAVEPPETILPLEVVEAIGQSEWLGTDAGELPRTECAPGDGCPGDLCTENSQCQSGWCVDHLSEGVCSSNCEEECPPGWSCEQVAAAFPDVVYICVSKFANLCRPCVMNADCKSVGGMDDVCVNYGEEGSYCGGRCQEDGICPEGFACQDVVTVDGIPTLQCIPNSGQCLCSTKAVALSLWTPCELANEVGECQGKRICTEKGKIPGQCDAATAVPETCNGLDDDCDNTVDEASCDDGNACTEDVCQGAAGCEFVALDGNECLDGNPCTAADKCVQGVCLGDPVICEDGNVCTDDICTPAGGCDHVNNIVPCDDGNACTLKDECDGGVCSGVGVPCDCKVNEDCAALEDGDVCNGTLVCNTAKLPFQCAVDPATVIACPDPEGPDAPCLKPACDPVTGACGTAPYHDGFPCEDGDACTLGDKCKGAKCTGGWSANCNDGNLCTDDFCDAEVGCVHDPNSLPCQDGSACTVLDVCADSKCEPGAALDCDDGNICTDDACASESGCLHTFNQAVCDDGNFCTTGDHCSAGACSAAGAVTCDDGNVCTTDWCQPTVGCQADHNLLPCDDGNACTVGDTCAEGKCNGGDVLVCDDGNVCTKDWCDPLDGCQHANNTEPCDDNNSCTTADVCFNGQCKGTGALDCDDGNPCTKDICQPDGGCGHENAAGSCTDGDPCTLNDQCDQGICVPGKPLDCDDVNPCTDDSCNLVGVCLHLPNKAECDDGNSCTTGDHCKDGKCAFITVLPCDDGNVCTTDHCEPDGGCVHNNNTLECEDGNGCTQDDVCSAGKCLSGPPMDCDDENICTKDSCVAPNGCQHEYLAILCNDGNACTVGDACSQGVCKPGAALGCDDGNVCTTDSCKTDLGCVHDLNTSPCDDGDACTTKDVCVLGKCTGALPMMCNDGNPCTDDKCEAKTGCVFTVNAIPCNDGNACTINDVCAGGKCTGPAPLACNDGNVCTDDSCKPDVGCVFSPNTVACTDNDVCTLNDTCSGGICKPGLPKSCDDGNLCTTDSCSAVTGCANVANSNPCNDGNTCTTQDFCQAGVCVGSGTLPCDDGNPCTTDVCNPAAGCVFNPNALPCEDGNKCTQGDVCSKGLCSPGAGVNCNDGNVCTDEVCLPAVGCQVSYNVNVCNDGNACTLTDKCQNGNCVGSNLLSCNDGNKCTNDSCNPGSGCLYTPISPCCGNGIPEAGEACDDGNAVNGDGCETNCTKTPASLYWKSGPQVNVSPSELTGWSACFHDTYNMSNTPLSTVFSMCNKGKLMLACRPVGQSAFTVLAMGNRADVLYNTGAANNGVTHDANGVAWYFAYGWSWGFALPGSGVNKYECDTNTNSGQYRLCIHTISSLMYFGWRCGTNTYLNGASNWERYVYHAD